MSSMVRTLALPAALVVVGVAGATAYVVTRPAAPPAATPVTAAATPAVAMPAAPAAKPAPEPPPAPVFVAGAGTPAASSPAPQPAAAAPEPAPAAMQAPPDAAPSQPGFSAPVTTAFDPEVKPYSLVRDSAAYVAATLDAPQMYPLRAGTAVSAVARSADNKWVIALTETGQAAFLPAVDLGPYDPRLSPAPVLPATVSGVARVVDTGNLVVNDQQVKLAGVTGVGGIYTAQLQSLISSQGAQVQCTLQGAAYVCTLPNGLDIARTALYNGGADLANDASDDYRAQAASARAAHKGIWK